MASRKLKVADLFCGAGGSSEGARRKLAALGYEMELLCVNHWDVAIATHAKMHPNATHYCQDLSTIKPRDAVPGGVLDLLMASPTCTYHSRARGGKPTSDQQRMDPWHVVTWLTELSVARLLVENVPEFVDWGPIDEGTGRPIKGRKGEYFQAWIDTIQRLGFAVDWRILNCADYGDATTRKRFFLQGRATGRVSWPMPTHARRGDALGLRPWRPAREIIDWSLRGRSIFGRKKPLAATTLARIYAGMVKFQWPEPFLVVLRNHADALGVDLPLPAITAGGLHIGLAQPFVLNAAHGVGAKERNPHDSRIKPISAPIGTIHAGGGSFGVVEPFVLSQHNSGAARDTADPLPTITTGGAAAPNHPGCARPMLVEPFMLSGHAEGAPRAVEEPMPGMTAKNNGPVLIAPYYGSGSGKSCSSDGEPLPTVTTKARFGMVMPITHPTGGNRARDLDEPIPTVTTAHRGELAFVCGCGGRAAQSPATPADAPLGTITAKNDRVLVEPGESVDILFRMLEPHELAAAMGFNDGEREYEFAGNKTEIVRQIGNAVPCNTAAALVGAMFDEEVEAEAA